MNRALNELYLKSPECIGFVWDVSTEEGWNRADNAIEAYGRQRTRVEVLDLDRVVIWFSSGEALELLPR
jgi:hypothetical protein